MLTVYEQTYIMVSWQLRQYVSPMGRKAVDDWRKGLPAGVPRADLDAFLKNIVKERSWEYPVIGGLSGRHSCLTELRWRSKGKPHRILGYQLQEFEYLMLIGCTHDKKKYKPSDALETALRRRKDVEEGRASYCEYQLVTDQ